MGAWTLIQVVFDIFAALGFFVIVMRMNRAPKDDPRLSRGLQLLQSKISVLEDLSDRTEQQVSQLVGILDQKGKEVQAKIQLAEQHVHAIRVSMERSLGVAKIFQDKIPHQEIIERQNTIKYVKAARLAHQGQTAEEIAAQIDLPKGEIEFIAKVNREQLMFNENELPDWVRAEALGEGSETQNASQPIEGSLGHLNFQEPGQSDQAARLKAEMELAERQRLVEDLSRLQFEMQNLDMQLARENVTRDMATAFEAPKVETHSLQKLGEEFRKAVEAGQKHDSERASSFPPIEHLASLIPQVFGVQAEAVVAQPAQVAVAQPTQAAAPAPLALQPQPPQPAPMQAPAAAPETRDPVLSRAMAQAKVQAALNSGIRAPAAAVPQSSQQKSQHELETARAVARASSSPQPVHVVNSRPGVEPVIVRKVQFPKIDAP